MRQVAGFSSAGKPYVLYYEYEFPASTLLNLLLLRYIEPGCSSHFACVVFAMKHSSCLKSTVMAESLTVPPHLPPTTPA